MKLGISWCSILLIGATLLVSINGIQDDWVRCPQTENQYLIVRYRTTFDHAQAHCRALLSNLAVPTTATENLCIFGKFPHAENVWLGMRRINNRWLSVANDRLLNYTNWEYRQPDSPWWVRVPVCASFYPGGRRSGLKWDDRGCNYFAQYFVCERKDPNADGWTRCVHSEYSYIAVQQQLTISDAVNVCKSMDGASLALPRNARQNNCVYEKFKGLQEVWLGMRLDESSGRWLAIADNKPLLYVNWLANPPLHIPSVHAAMYQSSNGWIQRVSSSPTYFVCQRRDKKFYEWTHCTGSGYEYLPVHEATDYFTADRRCRSFNGGSLATPLNAVQDQCAFDTFAIPQFAWLGFLFSLGRWVTLNNGQSLGAYQNWEPGQPDGNHYVAACVTYFPGQFRTGKRWDNTFCHYHHVYVCQREYPRYHDECKSGAHNCKANQACVNDTPGFHCRPIQCWERPTCPAGKRCLNNGGGYLCVPVSG